ncbi:MAG: DUF1834 family protein [Proteobacteria bacterium]|nr:DUF1834 family protein [Pseudomonadota bacterium]
MSVSITSVEQAILARIKSSALGSALKTADSYQRVLEAMRGGLLPGELPAVYVMFTGGPVERVSQKFKLNAEFTLYAAAQNLRSVQAAKADATAGAYFIVNSLIALFAGHQLGLAITPMIPGGVDPMDDDELSKMGVVMYGIRFRTSFVIDPVNDEILNDLTEMFLNFDLPGETSPRVVADMTAAKDGI